MLVAVLARFISRVVGLVTNPPAPRAFGAAPRRVLALLLAITLLCLLPLRLSPHTARVAVGILVVVAALALLSAAAWFQRLLRRIVHGDQVRMLGGRVQVQVPTLDRQIRVFEGAMALLRRTGIALPALLFFCAWALVYLLIWAHSPASCPADPAHPCAGAAFLGAGRHPTFGDFLYFSANMAFANPVPDLIAHSRVAHTAATVEVLSGVGLVTLYAGAFFGLGQSAAADPQPPSRSATRSVQ